MLKVYNEKFLHITYAIGLWGTLLSVDPSEERTQRAIVTRNHDNNLLINIMRKVISRGVETGVATELIRQTSEVNLLNSNTIKRLVDDTLGPAILELNDGIHLINVFCLFKEAKGREVIVEGKTVTMHKSKISI